MSVFTNNTFVNQIINLDENEFDGNRFQNCTLIYGGGHLVFNNNVVDGVTWEFVGAASRTLAIIRSIYQMEGESEESMEMLLLGKQTKAVKKEDENE